MDFGLAPGNIIEPEPGRYLLCGRYRNHGDSRTGTGAGARRLEFAIFEGTTPTGPFTKIRSFTKQDLSRPEAPVVSIEGGKLFVGSSGVEMIISTEKGIACPEALGSFQKPGTGVWSIDRIGAASIEALDSATMTEVQSSGEGATLHVKDPVVFDSPASGTALMFVRTRSAGRVPTPAWPSAVRGASSCCRHTPCWNAEQRGTLPVRASPIAWLCHRWALLAGLPPLSLYFYDGAECLRSLDENAKAVSRPRRLFLGTPEVLHGVGMPSFQKCNGSPLTFRCSPPAHGPVAVATFPR